MGTFTDNLLKLTEFPFSYSFISLIAFISFGESFLNQPIARLGSLLILMGFVATTLSITDPIGALQRALLRDWKRRLGYTKTESMAMYNEEKLRLTSIFGGSVYSLIVQPFARGAVGVDLLLRPSVGDLNLGGTDLYSVLDSLNSIGDSTLRTPWMRREIDKITSMVYFIIVILTFILSLSLLPNFEDKFLSSFPGGNQVRIIIIAFSLAALGALLYMFERRRRELRDNALTAFLYLLVKEGYISAEFQFKLEDEAFEKRLQEVERYLDNGDWILASSSVDSLRFFLNGSISEKVSEKAVEERIDYREFGIY
jgi:hypothetical protein